jgi:hypothetical protein
MTIQAGRGIRDAMSKSTEVWLMGISLNEFCRQEQGPFSEAWEALVNEIRAGRKRRLDFYSSTHTVMVVFFDPIQTHSCPRQHFL